jgi:nucleoside-diphosphate-sugar epimerase
VNNLVIGSSGFVGRYLVKYLRDFGENVREYDIVRDNQEDCRCGKLPLHNINRVYFLGWKVGGANYLYNHETQREQLEWNIKILTNCMDQLQSVPFVFVSTQLAENCETIYGVLKRLGEFWTELNGGRVIRLWNVYGAYEPRSIKAHVVADFVHQALSSGIIRIMTTGEEVRQFIYISDVCNSLRASFDYKGIYDASTLQWNSVYEAAKLVSIYTGCQVIRGDKIGSSSIYQNKPTICEAQISLKVGIKTTVELFAQKLKT